MYIAFGIFVDEMSGTFDPEGAFFREVEGELHEVCRPISGPQKFSVQTGSPGIAAGSAYPWQYSLGAS